MKSDNNVSAKSVRANSVGWMLKSLSTEMDQQMIDTLKPHGLNLGQFGILMTLLEDDGLIQSEIGKKISMPGYATTRNIDALEQAGYLKRQKNEASRRSYRILLTEKGQSFSAELFAIVKKINQNAVSALDDNETLMLKQLLSKMLEADNRKRLP